MDIEVQWDNPAHFLLDRNKNKGGITVELFAVALDKAPTWFDGGSQTPVPIASRRQSPMGFEVLTVATLPTLVVLQFTVRFKDNAFDEILLLVRQLWAFDAAAPDASKWTPSAWMPVLPEGAAELSRDLPASFNFMRTGTHPLIASLVHQGDKVTIKITTKFLDVTALWWKAIAANSQDASGFTARQKEFLLDLYHRWYEWSIRDTGSRICALASTAPAPPLLWFVIVPVKVLYNQDGDKLFSQVYYRPAGWMPEGRWGNNVKDIIGANRTQKALPMLLWCVMNPVKVLEEADYAAYPNLIPFVTDRFKLVLPDPFNASSKGAQRVLIVPEGIWSPQRMAASVSEAGKPQVVFIPLRHDDQTDSTKSVETAVQPNLHLLLRTAVNVLWCQNHVSIATMTLDYDDEFVVAGYSAGGFNLWFAAEKNIDKVKALIAVEPMGIPFPEDRLKKVVDSLRQYKRKIFFVGQYKTKGDMGVLWKDRGQVSEITYLPNPATYDDYVAFKPLTTKSAWLKYVFTGLKKRDDEAQAKNSLNKEPHPEPDMSLEERKAINKLGFTSDAAFGSRFTGGNWTGIPVLHLFAMCGGQVFTPPTMDSKGIVTADAVYKTFYQECMEAL